MESGNDFQNFPMPNTRSLAAPTRSGDDDSDNEKAEETDSSENTRRPRLDGDEIGVGGGEKTPPFSTTGQHHDHDRRFI